ncbi:hypothetical protein ACHAPT_006480 [Fusarium lateritium]
MAIHDLQPYHCTYEDCTDPNRTYRLRQDWIDHENQHRRVWHCHVHGEEFETQPEYIRHLQHRQDEHKPEDRLPEMIATIVASSSKPHRDCPFCPTSFSDVPTMQKHVRYHLERLALYALPDVYEQEGDELASEQPSDSHRLVENRGRRESISRDFTESEEQSFLEVLGHQQPHESLLTAESLKGLVEDGFNNMSSLEAWRLRVVVDGASAFNRAYSDVARSDEVSSRKAGTLFLSKLRNTFRIKKAGTSSNSEGRLGSDEEHDVSNEGIIWVLGATGSGKSYFLNKLMRSDDRKGYHSLESAPAQCQAVQIFLDDQEKRSITVIDIPGFDDTNKPQGESLAEMAEFLAIQHVVGVPLLGVLYLHKITENRMTGSSLTYLNLLQSLIGHDALRNVILVTTMWNKLRDQDRREAVQREQELIDKYWNPMIDKGSYTAQFDGTADSAFALVFQLANKESVVLDIQKQLVDQDRPLLDTSAGTVLARNLEDDMKAYRERVTRQEALLRHERNAEEWDMIIIRTLEEEKAQVEQLLQLAERSMDRMRVRPESSIGERIKRAVGDGGMSAAAVVAAVLNVPLTVVQLGFGV